MAKDWKDMTEAEREAARKNKALVLSNMEEGDVTFEHDRGVWNITRAKRECEEGKHLVYMEDVEAVYRGSRAIEFDEVKVKAMMKLPMKKFEPLIAVIDGGMVWLIDGRHRLEVYHRKGVRDFTWYVIEENYAARYRVLFNGELFPPWKKN